MNYKMTPAQVQSAIREKLSHIYGVSAKNASDDEFYKASALVVRDLLVRGRDEFVHEAEKQETKQIYYLCMEFLLGRSLKNNLFNLGLEDSFRKALSEMGVKLDNLYEQEPDAGLGNGGLGRLAACFLDGLATQGYPAMGYSLRYEYGIFRQKLVEGWQTELPDVVSLLQHLPRNLTGRLLATLPAEKRARIRQIMRYADNSVGSIMEFEVITVRPEATLAAVQRYLRRLGKMPENTDKLFVTTRNKLLLGELELQTILLNDAQKRVGEVMEGDPVTFQPHEEAEKVARTFERDDLLSAAVIDADGKLMGRLTIDEIVDVVYEETDNDLRRMGGLSNDDDVFAPVSKAVKTRWAWLAVNLCTAFIASRVIDGFEHTISQLVALASLMPIVAGIGGNTGNQTITMIVRAMALQQIQPGSFTFLILREMGVALINGLVWGGIMGAITWWLYDDPQLGGVMTLAMMLNLLMAAMMGVIIPMVMVKLGRDPAVGSSVMITAITDTGGFFIFLGLATLFLM